jgi:hypothetical protein
MGCTPRSNCCRAEVAIPDSYRGNAAALTGRNLLYARTLHASKATWLFSRPRSTIMVIRMPFLLTRTLVEEELKLQLDIKADKGSEPTPDKGATCRSPISLCLQVRNLLSHEQD